MTGRVAFVVGLLVASSVVLAVPGQASPDWTKFRLTGSERTPEDVLAAMHAFDPSFDPSQIHETKITAPLGAEVVMDSSGALTVLPTPALDAGGSVYACAVVALASNFGGLTAIPDAVPPNQYVCGGDYYPGGISHLAEVNGGLFGYVMAFGNGGGGFNFAEIVCQLPGAGVFAPSLIGTQTCWGRTYGLPISAWGSWDGYQGGSFGVSVGAAF